MESWPRSLSIAASVESQIPGGYFHSVGFAGLVIAVGILLLGSMWNREQKSHTRWTQLRYMSILAASDRDENRQAAIAMLHTFTPRNEGEREMACFVENLAKQPR